MSSVKLFSLLKETSKGEFLFPLNKNFKSANVTRVVLGTVAFCQICELDIKTALNAWRSLQEAAATYVMLELAPDKIIQEAEFSQSEISKARLEILKSLSSPNSPDIYIRGYEECLEAKEILRTNHVFPAILISSGTPLYVINLFQPSKDQKNREFRGDKFALEIERFCANIQLENMSPLKRFRKIVSRVKESKESPLNEQTLDIFNQFVIPDLFPKENWQEKIDKWVIKLIETFGDFSPDIAPKALYMYHQMVDLGWTPLTAFHDNSDTQIQMMKGREHGFLRYLLGNLKIACFVLPDEPIIVYFPQNLEELDIANWVYEFENIISKHDLPFYIER